MTGKHVKNGAAKKYMQKTKQANMEEKSKDYGEKEILCIYIEEKMRHVVYSKIKETWWSKKFQLTVATEKRKKSHTRKHYLSCEFVKKI